MGDCDAPMLESMPKRCPIECYLKIKVQAHEFSTGKSCLPHSQRATFDAERAMVEFKSLMTVT